MSQPIATWLKALLPRTPGASRPVVLDEFRAAAREFFTRSFAWREVIGPFDSVAAQTTYSLTSADPLADVAAVLQVDYNGRPLNPAPSRPPLVNDSADIPTAWYGAGLGAFSLSPVPSTGGTDMLVAYVALTLKPAATDVPDYVYTHFYDALFDGTLGRLYAHPAKPYSNTTGAQYHLGRFRAAIAEGAGMAKEGLINAQNWRYPRFGK